MHFHIEIIIPPTDDVEAAVSQVMEQFDENGKDEDSCSNSHAFWDWYVIGGRWAGHKLKTKIGAEKIQSFREKLVEMKITVSGLQAGKPTLQPASQIPMVDALWREWFPDCGVDVCPLFDHSNDQYSNKPLIGDVCTLADMPDALTATRVIFAKQHWDDSSKLEPAHMFQDDFWNGCNHVKSTWDGNVKTAVDEYLQQVDGYRDEWKQKNMPQGDWLVVTVDCHS